MQQYPIHRAREPKFYATPAAVRRKSLVQEGGSVNMACRNSNYIRAQLQRYNEQQSQTAPTINIPPSAPQFKTPLTSLSLSPPFPRHQKRRRFKISNCCIGFGRGSFRHAVTLQQLMIQDVHDEVPRLVIQESIPSKPSPNTSFHLTKAESRGMNSTIHPQCIIHPSNSTLSVNTPRQ